MKIEYATPAQVGSVPTLRRALLGLGLLSLAAAAPAATVTGGASIDWSSLSIEVVSGNATFELSNQETYLFVDDNYYFDYEYSPDWTTSLLRTTDYGFAQLTAAADASNMSVGGSMDDSGYFQYLSRSASRFANLTITGTGTLLVSVAGAVFGDASTTDPNTGYGSASGYISINLSNGPLSSSGYLSATADSSGYYPIYDLQSRVLTAALSVIDGDRLFLNIGAYSDMSAGRFEPVPVPAALPLLGSALLGLAGIKRARGRRSREASVAT